MKIVAGLIIIIISLSACNADTAAHKQKSAASIAGSWKLLTGTIIQKGDTTVTDYTIDKSFVKIINETHFSFLLHDLQKGKDSLKAAFVAGGGRYELNDSLYTEHLEYCSNRPSEGQTFTFTISIKNDTLVQSGFEKTEATGESLFNIEKYVRVKD